MKQIGLRWPEELIARIDRAAEDTDSSRSEWIRDACEKVLEHVEAMDTPFERGKPATAIPVKKEVPEIRGLVKASEIHTHKRETVIAGGWWKCECGATSPDNGRTWK